MSTFGPAGPGWQDLSALLVPSMPQLDPKAASAPPLFRSDEALERAFTEVGLHDPTTTHLRVGVPFGTVERWERFSRSVGQSHAWRQMTPPDHESVRSAAATILAEHPASEFWQDARITVGTRPRSA